MHDVHSPYNPFEALLLQEFDPDPRTVYTEGGWFSGSPATQAFPQLGVDDEADGGWEAAAGGIPSPRTGGEEAGQGGYDPAPGRTRMTGRRRRQRPAIAALPQLLGSVFWALTALTVAVVSLLSWMFAYQPLQDLAAARVSSQLARLWPVIVYGPWLVACLSILRAALDRRPIAHSWAVVILFSSTAAGLCVTQEAHTLAGMIVAGLPPLTSVVSFHQLVRQIMATPRPRHAPVPRAATVAPGR